MENGRVERVTEAVFRLVNPTEAELRELFTPQLCDYVLVEWDASPGLVLFTTSWLRNWVEFSCSPQPGMVEYLTFLGDDQPYPWRYSDAEAEQCNGFSLIDSGVEDWVGCSPSLRSLLANFAPHVVDKMLWHLGSARGDVGQGEVACVGIRSIIWNRSLVLPLYATRRPDGTEGTKAMRFYTHRHVMRCLALTEFKPGVVPSVLLVNEYRRSRGGRLLMCPSGGEDLPTLLDVLAAELRDETGSELKEGCRVYDLGPHFTDDGVSSDPVNLLVVTGLEHVPGHTNLGEGISEVVAMPWTEFLDWVRTPDCRDMYAKIFATAVSLDVPKGEVVIQWPNEEIM